MRFTFNFVKIKKHYILRKNVENEMILEKKRKLKERLRRAI